MCVSGFCVSYWGQARAEGACNGSYWRQWVPCTMRWNEWWSFTSSHLDRNTVCSQLLGEGSSGVRDENEGPSTGGWSKESQPVCQVSAAARSSPTSVGLGFVSKPQSGSDSEGWALSLGWGIRWAEGLCWYIQGDLKMWSAWGMNVWACVFASEHQAGVAGK